MRYNQEKETLSDGDDVEPYIPNVHPKMNAIQSKPIQENRSKEHMFGSYKGTVDFE